MCGKMCGKIEKWLDQNKIWCGTRYGPHDYDSGEKKTKRQKDKKTKMQKCKKTKRQKGKKAKRQKRQKCKKTKWQKGKKTKRQKEKKKKKNRGPQGCPRPPQDLEQGGHRPPKF